MTSAIEHNAAIRRGFVPTYVAFVVLEIDEEELIQ
jgi:hypothetical protein